MKTFKYRLQPSKSQRTKLMQTLELCRWVYNETLATRKNAWEQEKKSLSLYDTNKLHTLWKQEHPELRDVFSQVLQNVQERVDLASRRFFVERRQGKKRVIHVFVVRVGTTVSPTNNLVLSCWIMVCFFPKLGL